MTNKRINEAEISSVDLMKYGLDHLGSGFFLMKTKPNFYDSGGYLIHVGYECILKAWLFESKKEIKRGHNLIQIANNIDEFQFISLPDQIKKTIELVNQYQYLRYPNLIEPIEIGDEVLASITTLVEFTLSKVPKNILPRSIDESITKGNRILMKKPIRNENLNKELIDV